MSYIELYNNQMEEQEQYILEDQALNVLSLFPKREAHLLMPSLSVYAKLFESLTCTICREVFSNPVYLKCSHRFCKDCIEKYIRSNSRKSCPNCRGGLSTKRDLRSDFNLESLITFAFGDTKKMSRQLEEIQRLQLSQLDREKGLELRRAESLTDLKPKVRFENGIEPAINVPYLKRYKTVDGEDLKRRKKEPSEKKTKPALEGESPPPRKVRQMADRTLKKEQDAPSEGRRRKKNHVMVIEIQSSDPIEVQEIPPEQFFQGEETIIDNNKLASLMCSISMIPEVSEIQSAKKIASMRQIEKDNGIKPDENADMTKMIVEQAQAEKEPSEMIEEVPAISPQVAAARQGLKLEFGNNFLNKILELTDYPIFMRLHLKKHPAQPFTPCTAFQQIKILAKTTVSSIGVIISSSLNINKQAVKLYVCEDHLANFIEVSPSTKLQEINNRFWRSFGGFEIIDFNASLQTLSKGESDSDDRYRSSWQNRILYYAVDYSKIIV